MVYPHKAALLPFGKVAVKEEKLEDVGRSWEKLEGDEAVLWTALLMEVGSTMSLEVSVWVYQSGPSPRGRSNQRHVTLAVMELVKWSLEGCYLHVASGCSLQSMGQVVRDGR